MLPVQNAERVFITAGGAPQQNVVAWLLRNVYVSWRDVPRTLQANLRSSIFPGTKEKSSRGLAEQERAPAAGGRSLRLALRGEAMGLR